MFNNCRQEPDETTRTKWNVLLIELSQKKRKLGAIEPNRTLIEFD